MKQKTQNPFEKYQLGEEEAYDPSVDKVFPFKLVGDPIDGIEVRYSNMAGGFPFEFEGRTWKNSEELYLLGEFSTGTDRDLEIQNDILSATSGYAAKRFKKAKYKAEVRKDFTEFRLQWMWFVVWQKCKGSEAFRRHLFEAPLDAILVENTTTDNGGSAEIWGCRNPELTAERKKVADRIYREFGELHSARLTERKVLEDTNKVRNHGIWRGQNNIGKILMICREALIHGIEPPIDYQLLSQYDIHILGKKIDFCHYAAEAEKENEFFTERKYNANDFRMLDLTNRVCRYLKEHPEQQGPNNVYDIPAICRIAIHNGARIVEFFSPHDCYFLLRYHLLNGRYSANNPVLMREDVVEPARKLNFHIIDLNYKLIESIVTRNFDEWKAMKHDVDREIEQFKKLICEYE